MDALDLITRTIVEHYPATQAIYLYGTFGTADERPDSDVDLAVLLPPVEARERGMLALSPCHLALMDALRRDVDLVNLRQVSTVFQNEIVSTGRLIFCADERAVGEFEMLSLSLYMKLNEERREILAALRETKRAYDV